MAPNRSHNDVVVIAFDGGIQDFPVLIQTLDGMIADGQRHFAIDLASLPFINSAALGYLVKAYKHLQAEGGELALCSVQPAIATILEMTQLDQVFPVFATEEEAVAYLGGDLTVPVAEGRPSVQRRAWRR
jgi:anti-sigma B factor antagonist